MAQHANGFKQAVKALPWVRQKHAVRRVLELNDGRLICGACGLPVVPGGERS